jgi:hypothetical protein
MNRDNSTRIRVEAKQAARQSGQDIAVLHDPLGCAEESGDYGYCPVTAVDILFPHGEVIEIITDAED